MKQKQPKARNPFVQHLITKKQGAHQKPKKVERKKEKAKLRKEWLGQVAVCLQFHQAILFWLTLVPNQYSI